MTPDTTTEHDTDAPADAEAPTERMTAPMSNVTAGDATMGLIIALVGLTIVLGVPLATMPL